ncbi:MAG: hypothetical protein ACK559_32550 [bacterium]
MRRIDDLPHPGSDSTITVMSCPTVRMRRAQSLMDTKGTDDATFNAAMMALL